MSRVSLKEHRSFYKTVWYTFLELFCTISNAHFDSRHLKAIVQFVMVQLGKA